MKDAQRRMSEAVAAVDKAGADFEQILAVASAPARVPHMTKVAIRKSYDSLADLEAIRAVKKDAIDDMQELAWELKSEYAQGELLDADYNEAADIFCAAVERYQNC
jgi:hypothetical protein